MLVSFSVENFQSIRERITLDMRKANIDEHKDSLIEKKYLPVSVLYGPNGGGKSTVLKAFNMFCQIFKVPLIMQSFTPNTQTPVFIQRPLPFLLDEESKDKSTKFEAVIEVGESIFRLYLECYQNTILSEILQEKKSRGKPLTVYERNEKTINTNIKGVPKVLNISAEYPALSLIRQQYGEIAPIKEVFDWIMYSSMIDYGMPYLEDQMKIMLKDVCKDESQKNRIRAILNSFNLGVNDFDFEYLDKDKRLFQIKTYHELNNRTYELSLPVESMGTQKLINLLPLLLSSLENGRLLVVDELDAKLHPKMLEQVIKLYTDKQVNTKGAQLIFTSHDLSTMNSKVFRRDEIWFAAKDDAESTRLYSLVDIRDEKGEKIRSDAAYGKQYLEGRYGADPYFYKMNKGEW